MAGDDITVTRNEAASRFELRSGGHTAELVYRQHGSRLVLLHTGVPPELEGHGFGGRLVTAAVQYAAAAGLTVVPLCPFTRAWLERHPGLAGSAAIEWGAGQPPGNPPS
jgi:predicted GNAT family acetyltransferase